MSDQPEALRMADQLDRGWAYKDECSEIAAELRRLLAVEAQRDALRAELKEATASINDPAVNNLRTLAESIRMLSNQRDALLEALKQSLEEAIYPSKMLSDVYEKARAAIKMVEEGK